VPVWSAERTVDEPLVRRLVSQFEELDASSVRHLSWGWDYSIWVIDERWAFRFPRREVVVRGMEVEIAVVPQLAASLPIDVPTAEYVGAPTEEFPWPFFGSRLLPGRELSEVPLSDLQRLELGLELADFLRTLHALELDVELPEDSNRRADMQARVPIAREQLAELSRNGAWDPPAAVDELLAEAERLPPSSAPHVVAHGDLHVRQLLSADGRLTGVLDWVDLCRTDPSIDLLMYWSFLEDDGRRAFLERYGRVDDEALLRARVVALSVGAALALYGHDEGHAAVAREALAGLERTVS
jgi:aminoglycoside phosphotransferase (APT) family kinase protein